MKIEIELETLLEYFWHGREWGSVKKTEELYKIIEQVFQDDPGWKYRIYVQHEDLNGLPLEVPKLWRYSNWKTTADSHYKAKADSEVRVQCSNLKAEQIGKIIAAVQSKMFGGLSPELANNMAHTIYEKGDKLLAQTMGVDIDNIVWSEEIEQKVKTEIIPRLKQDGIA